MRFITIEIKPSTDDEWSVSTRKLDGDRVDTDRGPSALGFYHVPPSKPLPTAFQELKDLMIHRHQDEIDKLTESLNKLKTLNWGDYINDTK